MNRRKFLAISGISALGAAVGSVAYRVGAVWWDQEADKAYRILSPREGEIAQGIAEALFPGDHLGMPSGLEVGVVETVDDYLADAPEQTANLLRLLLHVIDDLGRVADLSMTPFRQRGLEKRIDILGAWEGSLIGARREAFLGLKLIFCMGYCEAPEVITAAGIDYECGGWR